MSSNPKGRAELIEYIRELASPSLQESLWIRNEDAPNSSGIDEVFHFFFDDTDIAERPLDYIGELFISGEEVDTVRAVTEQLDSLLKRLGDVGSKHYMTHSEWPALVAKSQKALDLLAPHGLSR